MRLFIAIHFNEKIKDQLILLQDQVTSVAPKCHPSRRENLHLTLAFLGEIDPERIEDLQRILQKTAFSPIELTFGTTGFFKGRDGNIYWAGIDKNDDLIKLQKRLSHQLREGGFLLDSRPFHPHITLARQVVFKKGKNTLEGKDPSKGTEGKNAEYTGKTEKSEASLPEDRVLKNPFSTKVDNISLMLSHQMKGRLVYTELYRKRAAKMSETKNGKDNPEVKGKEKML